MITGNKKRGALVKNNTKGKVSHRKVHDPKSQYNKEHRLFAKPILCLEPNAKAPLGKCIFEMTNKHNMLAHQCRDHGHKGDILPPSIPSALGRIILIYNC